MSLISALDTARIQVKGIWNLAPELAILIVEIGLGIAAAYLIVGGGWLVVLGLMLVLPFLILLHRYPFAALFVWLVLAPFLMITESTPLRLAYWVVHRGLPPATLGIILLSHLFKINTRELPRLGLPELGMAGYAVVSLLSIVMYNDEPLATTYLFYDRVLIPMCLYLVIRLSTPNEKDLQRLMPIILFLGASQSIIGIIFWIAPHLLPPTWVDPTIARATGSLGSYGVYGVTVIFPAFFLLHAALNRQPGLVRTLYLGGFLLSAFGIFVSFSRATWLAAILIILALFYAYPKFLVRLGSVFLILGLLWGLLATDQLNSIVSRVNERLYSAESERSALSRLPVILAAVRMFEAQPVFGWGYGNFDIYDRQFQGAVADLPNDNKDHASHNFYLTLLAEQGLVGFSLFLMPLVGWLLLSLKALPRIPAQGFWSKNLLLISWLLILSHIVVNNFSNMRVVFGLGLWWMSLGLIANLIYVQQASDIPVIPGENARASLAPGGAAQ